jgi:hypothetical protein
VVDGERFSFRARMPINELMTGPATDPTRTEPPRLPTGGNEPWERERAARERVRALLQDLPPGFVVFDALELPRPTIAVVDHLVIGPRNVWAVTTHVSSEPITFGRGRNADTLWSGSTSMRTVLEAADWEAAALADHIGFAVEPVVCIVAPELPESAFDFYGIRICEPSSLVRQVATSTADFVDVTAVAGAVRRAFGVEPAAGTAPPTLATSVPTAPSRPAMPRRHRTLGARVHALKSQRAVRVGAVIALGAVIVAALPTIVGVWKSVASEGADRITAVIDDDALAEDVADDAAEAPGSRSSAPAAVGYVFDCPEPGAGWVIEWSWPGPLQPGVSGYSIRTRAAGGPTVEHTTGPWNDPASSPSEARVGTARSIQVITDQQAADGSVVASVIETVVVPTDSC